MTGAQMTAYSNASLDDRWRYAQAIAQAGNLVPPGLRNQDGSMNAGKVLMVMEQAVALGFHPMVGVNQINVIDGKVTLPPALMQAAIRGAGHTLRVRKTGTVEGGDFAVTAILIRSDDPDYQFEATWTPQRAHRAGLCTYSRDARRDVWEVKASSRSGKPLPWQAYTEAMCKARAISEVCMEGATDVLMGAVYAPEELGALVNESGVTDGTMVDAVEVVGPEQEPVQAGIVSAPSAASAPVVADPTPAQDGSDWQAEIDACTSPDEVRALWFVAQEAGQFAVPVGDVTLKEAIERRGALLVEQVNAAAAEEILGAHAEAAQDGAVADVGAETVPAVQDGDDSPADGATAPEDDLDRAWNAS